MFSILYNNMTTLLSNFLRDLSMWLTLLETIDSFVVNSNFCEPPCISTTWMGVVKVLFS